MGMLKDLGRRQFLTRATTGLAALSLSGCDRLSTTPWFVNLLDSAEKVTQFTQHAVTGQDALAREYSEADLSPIFKSNGTQDPSDAHYQALAENGFADWHLEVGGLVERPMQFSLAELRAFPSRTQITRHDCVEGWSCIGKWKGVPVATVLDRVRPMPDARYVMFYCADPMEEKAGMDRTADTTKALMWRVPTTRKPSSLMR